MPSFADILTAAQNGVAAVNNLGQLLSGATINSSSIRVALASTFFIPSSAASSFLTSSSITGLSTTAGTVTTVNTSIGLTGGPITSSGTIALSIQPLTNSISSDIAISSASSYVTGPTVTQGSSGVFFASGGVTCTDTSGSANTFSAKLWDGTTVVDSRTTTLTSNALFDVNMSLSGPITNPSSNIKISVRGQTTTGVMLANQSGNGKDCTLTVMRIG